MQQAFLRFYVAAQNRKAAALEDGFVTAEHLAIAVVGVVIVGLVGGVFQTELKAAIERVFQAVNPSNVTTN